MEGAESINSYNQSKVRSSKGPIKQSDPRAALLWTLLLLLQQSKQSMRC